MVNIQIEVEELEIVEAPLNLTLGLAKLERRAFCKIRICNG